MRSTFVVLALLLSSCVLKEDLDKAQKESRLWEDANTACNDSLTMCRAEKNKLLDCERKADDAYWDHIHLHGRLVEVTEWCKQQNKQNGNKACDDGKWVFPEHEGYVAYQLKDAAMKACLTAAVR